MSDEQKTVLQMLSDGKVSADEAERLLVALTGHRLSRRLWTGRCRCGNLKVPSLPSDLPMYGLPLQM